MLTRLRNWASTLRILQLEKQLREIGEQNQRRIDSLNAAHANEIAGLEDTIRRHADEIRQLKTLEIPKLQRELEVEKAYAENMAAVIVRERKRIEAETAVHCLGIASGQSRESALQDYASADRRFDLPVTTRLN